MNVINHEFRTPEQIAEETGFIIDGIADALRNYPDTNSKAYACVASANGDAAFWVRTPHGNTVSARVNDVANLTGDLKTAFALVGLPVPVWTIFQQLEALIPLNRQAADQMVEQYSRLGQMRDADELMARETHIICNGFKTRAH